MERMKRLLTGLPALLFSGIVFIAILWLTLAPKPLGENPPPLFPGADKLAHAIMFGGFTSTLLLDWQRKHQWSDVTSQRAMLFAGLSAIFGIIIEFLQAGMGLGRGLEIEDMIADTCGAFLAGLAWIALQKNWSS